jgi:DNA-binding IclR family transcriptional regulator
MKPTQAERVLDYLSRHPGASAMQLINALAIPNYRARVSELRQAGHDIEVVRDKHGLNRYYLRSKPVQLAAGF